MRLRWVIVLGVLLLSCSKGTGGGDRWLLFGDEYHEANTSAELIDNLAWVYRHRNVETFEQLLADDATLPAFRFIAYSDGAPAPEWDRQQERILTRRMFEPQKDLPGKAPVPAELWMTSITITLTAETGFTERTDLYASEQKPAGLSPERWKVSQAIYQADILFALQGDIDYQVIGRSQFLVVEDLASSEGAAGRFRILEWIDLGPIQKGRLAVEPPTWGGVKGLYR